MEGATGSDGDSSDIFFSAYDAFDLPVLNETLDFPASSTPRTIQSQPVNVVTAVTLSKLSVPSLRHRRPSSRSAESSRNLDTNFLSCDSDASIEISSFRERRSNCSPDFKDGTIFNKGENSTLILASDQNVEGREMCQEISSRKDEPLTTSHEYAAPGLLVSLADLVIKAIFIQFNMLIRFLTFPLWLAYHSLYFVANPFSALKLARDDFKKMMLLVYNVVLESFSSFVPEMLKREHGIGKLAVRMIRGCFWSFYVGVVLSGLLMTGFFCASRLMSRIAEEPLHMTRSLNFDYTKASPDTLVMLMSSDGTGRSLDFYGKGESAKIGGGRAIPPNHKLHLDISLRLPESDHNRNVGVFQVRAEFISTNGKVMFSLSKPCMLRFKSSHIRFMEAFIRSGPLLAGYSSESQAIDLELRGFIEGSEPTASIRIALEQRAEFRPGVGIPEIYAGVIKIRSELSMLKRMIWSWRRTLLIWAAMGIFFWEVLIVLVCCRPVLFPRGKPVTDVSLGKHDTDLTFTTS